MQLYATCRPFPERASVLVVAVGLVAWNRGSCRVVRIASFCGRFAAGIEGASPQEKRKAVAGFQPAQAPRQRGNFRRLKTCGHVGRYAATSGNLWPTQKTPPRTAPSRMPPAVRRVRHALRVIGSSAPGAASSRGQASFAIRVTQIWWLSPFSSPFSSALWSAARIPVAAVSMRLPSTTSRWVGRISLRT
jgi:hypothetical protein